LSMTGTITHNFPYAPVPALVAAPAWAAVDT
jgi:hypothetical protein